MRVEHTFGPVWNDDSRILILGSIPSVKSREQGFYYGHPRNRFWKVLAAMTGEEEPQTVPQKKEFLLRWGIALWDVIASCEIEGSSDSSIRDVTPNDIKGLLEKSGEKFQYPVYWGCDLQTEHERYLTEKIFGCPVFVTDYPKEIKAFYMRLNDDGRTVAAMDLLVPGVGEIIGGSQREERLAVLQARMAECGLREEDYWWYLNLRRYGGTRHAGFGLGFERILMYLTGVSNIRDVLPYPRTVGNAMY